MMNKRLKELYQEVCGKDWRYDFDPDLAQKFADLIVRECLSQVDKIRDGCEADGQDEQALGADWTGLAIAKHFGVE